MVKTQAETCKDHPNFRRRDLGDGWDRCAKQGCKHTRPTHGKDKDK